MTSEKVGIARDVDRLVRYINRVALSTTTTERARVLAALERDAASYPDMAEIVRKLADLIEKAGKVVFILRNYNNFLQGDAQSFHWEDLFIHRFDTDFDKLVKFTSYGEAREFIDDHPEIKKDFNVWIEESRRLDWNGSRC